MTRPGMVSFDQYAVIWTSFIRTAWYPLKFMCSVCETCGLLNLNHCKQKRLPGTMFALWGIRIKEARMDEVWLGVYPDPCSRCIDSERWSIPQPVCSGYHWELAIFSWGCTGKQRRSWRQLSDVVIHGQLISVHIVGRCIGRQVVDLQARAYLLKEYCLLLSTHL